MPSQSFSSSIREIIQLMANGYIEREVQSYNKKKKHKIDETKSCVDSMRWLYANDNNKCR